MGRKSKYQPRLMDDVGAVLEKLAKQNGRTVPQELDFILRPLLLGIRHLAVAIAPNGDGLEKSAYPSIADELEIRAKGLRFDWHEKSKSYRPVKEKRK